MSNSSLAIHSGRGARRSTRVNQAIRIAVAGVDSFRGPYNEEVSTVTINCHGCKYESKHEVLPNAFVILELNGKGQDSKLISTRGHVKWTQRSPEPGGLFQTAIELDDPGNIWGIDSPPKDWFPYGGPRSAETDGTKARTVAVLKADASPATPKEEHPKPAIPRPTDSVLPRAAETRPVGQLIGGFQQQMEKMLSEAAEAVVHEKATALLNDMRAGLREEVKRVVAEATSSQSGSWMEESLKQMKQAGEETARARHAQWTKKIELDLQAALKRMEMRHRELEEVSERLTTKAQERLQGFLEASRKDAVDRIIARLKEQSTPVIEHARKITADLTVREGEVEKLCQQFVEKSAGQIEKSCARLDKQFEMMLRERVDSARAEFESAATAAAKTALLNVQTATQRQEAVAQTHMRSALEPITEGALATLKEKAAEISRQFAGEMSHYSRSHLEFVSGAISELAKGIGKLSRD
ncbi:MAG: hypothetical protein ACRD5M_05200 [Candidatus Acidiferrales bacterium]